MEGNKKIWSIHGGEIHSIETVSEVAQTLELLGKDSESAILNVFKELKDIMRTVSDQKENINKERNYSKETNSGAEKYNNWN